MLFRTLLTIFRWICAVTSLFSRIAARFTGLIEDPNSNERSVKLCFVEKNFLIPVLRRCKIPEHLGFVMDGNRRFARHARKPTEQGHKSGYWRLQRVLLWCFALGVKEVSVYAFSVDNFSRNKSEVDYLMDLAREKLITLCEDGGFVMEHRIRVRVWGDRSLLPDDLREICRAIETKTRDHGTGTFNILLAYSSRREMGQATDLAVRFCSDKSDLSWSDVSGRLYGQSSPDLIVRTSGETRLSDFMVWQMRPATVILFEKKLWPDYNIIDFTKSLMRYSLHRNY
jgi:ditrans,polycis-polyprenyl diphosphate synthase